MKFKNFFYENVEVFKIINGSQNILKSLFFHVFDEPVRALKFDKVIVGGNPLLLCLIALKLNVKTLIIPLTSTDNYMIGFANFNSIKDLVGNILNIKIPTHLSSKEVYDLCLKEAINKCQEKENIYTLDSSDVVSFSYNRAGKYSFFYLNDDKDEVIHNGEEISSVFLNYFNNIKKPWSSRYTNRFLLYLLKLPLINSFFYYRRVVFSKDVWVSSIVKAFKSNLIEDSSAIYLSYEDDNIKPIFSGRIVAKSTDLSLNVFKDDMGKINES